MFRYILRRVILAIPSILGVVIIVFFLSRIIGSPVYVLMQAESNAEDIQAIERSLGLDKPLGEQFVRYIGRVMRGDFGNSYWSDRPAMEIVMERFPATLQLAWVSLAFAIIVGIFLGMIVALNRDTFTDIFVSLLSLFGISMPSFWLGLMLILVFGVTLNLLPISGNDTFLHLVMPAFTLGFSMVAIIVRLIRNDLLDVIHRPYITTAYAKGLSKRKVIFKHALKNALIPTVTMIGLQFGSLLGGSVVVETVFAWPGLGRLMIQSIYKRDFPIIEASVFLYAIFFIVVNIVVDVIYSFLDPRIRYE
jgi:ABC-type dipeptide/oligopeptide/nickel transport system permease component